MYHWRALVGVDILVASTFMQTSFVSLVLTDDRKPKQAMHGCGMRITSPNRTSFVVPIRLFLNWDFCEATCFYHANLA